MSIIVNISADEMRRATEDPEVNTVAIEVPGAVESDKAQCIKCGGEGVVDLDHIKLQAIMEGLAWMHARACLAISDGEDLRDVEVSELINEAIASFSGTEETADNLATVANTK